MSRERHRAGDHSRAAAVWQELPSLPRGTALSCDRCTAGLTSNYVEPGWECSCDCSRPFRNLPSWRRFSSCLGALPLTSRRVWHSNASFSVLLGTLGEAAIPPMTACSGGRDGGGVSRAQKIKVRTTRRRHRKRRGFSGRRTFSRAVPRSGAGLGVQVCVHLRERPRGSHRPGAHSSPLLRGDRGPFLLSERRNARAAPGEVGRGLLRKGRCSGPHPHPHPAPCGRCAQQGPPCRPVRQVSSAGSGAPSVHRGAL